MPFVIQMLTLQHSGRNLSVAVKGLCGQYRSISRISNMASDWLADVPPTNPMPGLRIFANNMDFNIV